MFEFWSARNYLNEYFDCNNTGFVIITFIKYTVRLLQAMKYLDENINQYRNKGMNGFIFDTTSIVSEKNLASHVPRLKILPIGFFVYRLQAMGLRNSSIKEFVSTPNELFATGNEIQVDYNDRVNTTLQSLGLFYYKIICGNSPSLTSEVMHKLGIDSMNKVIDYLAIFFSKNSSFDEAISKFMSNWLFVSCKELCKKQLMMFPQMKVKGIVGEGGFGTVYKTTYNGTEFALKRFIDEDDDDDTSKMNLCKKELGIMKICNNENIVKCLPYIFVDKERTECVILMELATCSMYEYIQKKYEKNKKFAISVYEIKYIMKQINNALKYLKNVMNITHRDLKSENILMFGDVIYKKYNKGHQDYSSYTIKLCDFGSARDIGKNQFLTTTVGSEKMNAPEIRSNFQYSSSSDLFSIGLTMFEMYNGAVVFYCKIEKLLRKSSFTSADEIMSFVTKFYNDEIKKWSVTFDQNSDMSSFVDIVISLTSQLDCRITWDEYFNHPFFN